MKAPIVAAGLLVLIPNARALITLSPTSEIDLTNALNATYDSNVTGGPNGEDDTYFTYSPRLDYIRKTGIIQLQSNLGVNISRYVDHTNLNSEDVNAGLQLNLAEAIRGAFTGTLNANYTESAVVVEEINARIHSNTLTFGANGKAQLTGRMSLEGSTSYADSRRSGGADSDSLDASLRWSLQDFLRGTTLRSTYTYSYIHSAAGPFSPISVNQSSSEITAGLSRLLFPHGETTIFADAGYRFLNRSSAEKRLGLTNDGGYVFSTGINGPFLPQEKFPKLKSLLSLTYAQSAAPGLNDNGSRSLQGNIALDWQARENTTLGVGASQSRVLGITNLTATPTSVNFHIKQTLPHQLTANATVQYAWTTYRAPMVSAAAGSAAAAFYASSFAGTPRKDETLSFISGLTYAFAEVWTATLGYQYTTVSSSVKFGDYDHHLVNLNISCRY